jgi:hypothetical protein
MTDIASLNIRINSLEAKQAKNDLDQLTRSGQQTEKGMGSMSAAARKLGVALAAAFSFQQIISKTSRAVQEFANFERQMLRLESQIKATGRTGQTTAADMEKMAQAIDKATLQSAQGVRSAQAILMSFRNVSTDMMERILYMAADVSEVMGQDITSAARQMALALEDPERGISMLRRTGTTFTESQKEMIIQLQKAGNELEAQSAILEVMESQYGGTAKAAAEGLAGSMDLLSRNSTNIKIAIGEGLSPVVEEYSNRLAAWIENNQELIAQNVAETVEDTFIVVEKIVTLYDKIPDYVTGPAGLGLVGTALLGSTPGKVIAAIAMINELAGMTGNSLQDLVRKHNESGQAIVNLWNSIAEALGWTKEAAEQTFHVIDQNTEGFGRYSKGADKAGKTTGGLTDNIEDLSEEAKKAAESLKDLQVQSALDNWGFEDLDNYAAHLDEKTEMGVRAEETLAAIRVQQALDSYFEDIDNYEELQRAKTDAEKKAIEDRKRAEEKARREYEREWKRVYDDMHMFAADTFYDIFDGQLNSFEDFADQMLNIFKRMLANMAAEAAMTNIFKPMMNQMAGSALGNMFGLPSVSGGGTTMFPSFGGMSNLPGMGWLGATIPGTATYQGPGMGAALSGGATWGSALGAGALGSLGYSTLGSAIGLPTSGYSGITSGLGAAGMSAYGGSLASMTGIGVLGGPIGIAAGALLGGLAGSLFGSNDNPSISFATHNPKHPAGYFPGSGWAYGAKTTEFDFRVGAKDTDQDPAVAKQVVDYFESLFSAIEQTTVVSINEVLQEQRRKAPLLITRSAQQDLKSMSSAVFSELVDEMVGSVLGSAPSAFDSKFFKSITPEGGNEWDAFIQFSQVIKNIENFIEEFSRRVEELGQTSLEAYQQIQLVSGVMAEMDMAIEQITGSAVISQINSLSDTWDAYIDVMKQAQASAEQLTEAESKKNLVVGSQITGLTGTSLQSNIASGGDISSIIENSLTQTMAGSVAESIIEKYITPLNEAVGETWLDTGGDIDAVLSVIQGYDLGPAQDEINAFRDKIDEVFGSDVPEVIEEMIEDIRNSFEYLRTESEMMVRLLEAQGKTEQAIALERQHEIEDLQRAWGGASGPLEELMQQIWNLEDANEAAAIASEKAAAIASERASLERQLLQAQGDSAAIRQLELESLDTSNRALQERIWALQDEAASADRAAQSLSNATSARDSAASAYLSALKSEYSELESAFDSAKSVYVGFLNDAISSEQQMLQALEGRMNDAKSNYISALQLEASEQEALADSIGSAIDSIKKYRESLKTGSVSSLSLEQQQSELMLQQTILAGQAKAGDTGSVGELISVSGEYLNITKDLARNELEYAREVSRTALLMEDVESSLGVQKDAAEKQAESLQKIYESVAGVSRTADSSAAARNAYYSAKNAFDRNSHNTEIARLEGIIAEVTETNENAQTLAEAQAEYEAAKMALDESWYADEIAMLEDLLGSTKSIEGLMSAFISAQSAYVNLGGSEGFATGGSFTVGGSGGADSLSLPQLRVSPGEMVNISRPDVMSSMSEELAALRTEVRQLREENKAHAIAQIKSSQAIERNTDYLESWDVNGLPAEEAAA